MSLRKKASLTPAQINVIVAGKPELYPQIKEVLAKSPEVGSVKYRDVSAIKYSEISEDDRLLKVGEDYCDLDKLELKKKLRGDLRLQTVIEVVVTSQKLFNFLGKCEFGELKSEMSIQTTTSEIKFAKGKSYVVIGLMHSFNRKILIDRAKEAGANLFIIQMHGESIPLCNGMLSQLLRELYQQVYDGQFSPRNLATKLEATLPQTDFTKRDPRVSVF